MPLPLLLPSQLCTAQSVCNPAGNVILYSNYDGGPLTIQVDDSIPDLRVGVVSYEFVKINFIGPYAGMITEVIYAGYNGSNDHCGIGSGTSVSIGGAPNAVTDIRFAPTATFSNSNGYGSMVCAYSCDVTTSQGGCNTADQVAHYFLSEFGGVLRYHLTQYGCWSGTQAVSAGGNCCEDPLATGFTEFASATHLELFPNPARDVIRVIATGPFTLVDAAGREVGSGSLSHLGPNDVDITALAPGAYAMRIADGRAARFLVQR
ncbi:MAG: T9SS type A sorting domain-containing protein [Flavobacteriales bacterium]|nr:T9SS type A sorting domain-containing protein [Flavobacteriales bacterium]